MCCGKIPFYFVADAAFPLSNRVLKPYGDAELTRSQRRYDFQLSRARMVVEGAFGHLAQRFNIFTLLRTKEDVTQLAISTACHIHNFIKIRNPAESNMYVNPVLCLVNGGGLNLEAKAGKIEACTKQGVLSDHDHIIYFLSFLRSTPLKDFEEVNGFQSNSNVSTDLGKGGKKLRESLRHYFMLLGDSYTELQKS